ncbi:hypothetical protein [Yoonia sp. R78084]|uniref:hypothetical protein n=1 Tax=Yoonia sp. R78084 TaxID=3093869 RepID=UPI0037DC2D05
MIPDDGELLPDGLINTLSLFEGLDSGITSSARALSHVLDELDLGTDRLLGCPYDHELLRTLVFDTCVKRAVPERVVDLYSPDSITQPKELTDTLRVLQKVFNQYSISSDEVFAFEEVSLAPTAGQALLATLRSHKVGKEVLVQLSWMFRSLNDDTIWWLVAFSDLRSNADAIISTMEEGPEAELFFEEDTFVEVMGDPCLDSGNLTINMIEFLYQNDAISESVRDELLNWIVENGEELEICQSLAEKLEDEF